MRPFPKRINLRFQSLVSEMGDRKFVPYRGRRLQKHVDMLLAIAGYQSIWNEMKRWFALLLRSISMMRCPILEFSSQFAIKGPWIIFQGYISACTPLQYTTGWERRDISNILKVGTVEFLKNLSNSTFASRVPTYTVTHNFVHDTTDYCPVRSNTLCLS